MKIFPSHKSPGPLGGAGGLLKSPHMVEEASAGKAIFHHILCFGSLQIRFPGLGVFGCFGVFLRLVFFMHYVLSLSGVVTRENYLEKPPKSPQTPSPTTDQAGGRRPGVEIFA